jgi:O-antigen/teichoic acid export membrane protein
MIRQRLLTGTISNFAGKLSTVVVWFLLTPFVLSRLGPNGYALWVLMGAISSYGFLLDFGIGGAVVKYVAEHVARGEHAAARALLASAIWLYLALALATVVMSVLVAPTLTVLIGVAPHQQATAEWLVILTGVNVALAIAATPPMSVLRGLQRYDLYNAIYIGASLMEAGTTTAALLMGWGVIGMSIAAIPVTIASGAASIIVARRVAPQLPMGGRGANMAALRQIASFSSSLFAIQVAGRLQSKTDEFVIAFLGMLNAVTPYAVARKLGGVTELIAVQMLKAVMPLASELHAGAQEKTLRRLYIAASRIALGIAVPVAVVLAIIGGDLLTLWVGAAYAEHAPLVAVLGIASLITASHWPAVEILQGMAKHRLVATAWLAMGAANVALSALLLPIFGLIGVALGTLIPTTIGCLFVVMPFANRMLRVSWATALQEIWLPACVPGAIAATALWMLQSGVEYRPAIRIGYWIAATLVVYGIGYLSMPGAKAERQLISDMLKSGSRRFRAAATQPLEAGVGK